MPSSFLSVSFRNRKYPIGLAISIAVVGISTAVPPMLAGTAQAAATTFGLTAEYFPNVDLAGPPIVTSVAETVDFEWGRSAPIGLPVDRFSARFRGGIVAPTTGVYTFKVRGDDGVRLDVNNIRIVNDWSDHSVRDARGTVPLIAGQAVPIQLEYYERAGLASVKLEWSGPGVAEQVVPTAQLLTSVIDPTVDPPVEPPDPSTTFYVATTGNDDNPGTAQSPWRTLQKAAATLTPGQTVLVADGTYDGEVRMDRSGAPGQFISFAAAPGARPVVRVTEPDSYGFRIVGASYVRVEDFDISYQGPDASINRAYEYVGGLKAVGSNAGVVAHHIEFIGNYVHDFPGEGIATGEADYMVIQGNTVWNNSKWNRLQTSGISLYQSANSDYAPGVHNVIRGNKVFQNENRAPNGEANSIITDGNCIILDDLRRRLKSYVAVSQGSYESDTVIENNVCAGNGGRGIHILNSDNVLVRNNTFYNNLRTPGLSGGELTAHFFYDSADPDQTLARRAPLRRGNVRFVHNLVVSNQRGAEFATNDDRDRSNVVFERNFYVGTAPAAADGDQVQNSSGRNDIVTSVNPLVAPNENALDGDFRLKRGSAPIDAALTSESPSVDQTGFNRPFGNAADIGAFESR
jgi:parallel beta-helix repeat protein